MRCNIGEHPGSRGRDMNINERRPSVVWAGGGSNRFSPITFYKNFFSPPLRGVICGMSRYTHVPNFTLLRLMVAEKNGYGKKTHVKPPVYITINP